MPYKIRDWEKHFEADRSKQWKNIRWVPIPNKQGSGYRKIMAEKNGLEIFACWIALVQVGSLCSPRGDLTKYDLSDLSRLTLINIKTLESSIIYLSQQLDWIEVIENLDKNVKNLDKNVFPNSVGSSILCSSIQGNSIQGSIKKKDTILYSDDFETFWKVYPRPTSKRLAFIAWQKIPTGILSVILNALEWQCKSDQWTKENGQYIPLPATYLNQARWEDNPCLVKSLPKKQYGRQEQSLDDIKKRMEGLTLE